MAANRARAIGFMILIGIVILLTPAQAGTFPKALQGKIITSDQEIDVPLRDVVRKLNHQDNRIIRQSANQWQVYLVAFFSQPLPKDQLGVVVLDNKKEAVALAVVKATPGQTTLEMRLNVESTETPGQEHILQLYYTRGSEVVVLARKSIVLK